MAFTNLILTAKGKVLYAKAQLGKPLHFTRVAIGDGMLGNEPMTGRSTLVHEVYSMLIDAVQLVNNEAETSLITTMDNRDITVGYFYRELGIFARDPDTKQDVLCLYDNAGTDAEYIPTASVKQVYERLRFLLTINATGDVTFQWSGNPLYPTYDEFQEALNNVDISVPIGVHNTASDAHDERFAAKADLDPVTHKLFRSQLPDGVADGDIDCGLFGEAGPVVLHNAAAGAHALLSVDGNVLEAGAGDAALTEHERNPLAHQNLILDGNQG